MPDAISALYFLRGRDADGRLRRLVAERRGLRPVLGVLSRALLKRRALERLGFRSLGDWSRERLGVTARVVREWARVWDLLLELPKLRAAVVSGEVSWSVARRVVAHATPETDAAFVETVRGRTLRAVEALLRVAFEAAPPTSSDTANGEPDDRVRVSVPLAPQDHGRWAAALELARRMAGEPLPVWECAEAIAAETLAALPRAPVAQAAAACPARTGAPPSPTRKGNRRAGGEHGLRAIAFPLLPWAPLGEPPGEGLARLGVWAETASPHALDAALRRAMKTLQRIDHDMARILRQVQERRLFVEVGFDSFERYAEERAEVSGRSARRWVRLARLGPDGSALANAFRCGAITTEQARLVAESIPASAQAERLQLARGVTLRRLEEELGRTGVTREGVAFYAPIESASMFLLALEAVRIHLSPASGARGSCTDALLWMLSHAIRAWTEQGASFRDYADFERDGWRCTAPGCTARRNLQSHHIVFRSAGGADAPWNRTTLCAFHHHRGVHARRMSCRGRAPDGLVFELGLRPGGAPLLCAASGDVLLQPRSQRVSMAPSAAARRGFGR